MLAGEIGKPHGVGGEVYMVPISDDPHRWDAGAQLTHADGRTLVVEASRTHKGSRLLVKFAGIDSRTDAESLRGPVYVDSDVRRELDDDEYWPEDLVGCDAVDEEGRSLGTVTSVVPGAAQDLLEMDTSRGTRLVPLVGAIVVDVDIDARRVVLAPPEGLLD